MSNQENRYLGERRARYLNRHIPINLPSVEGWKKVPFINKSSEEIVPVGPYAPEYSDIFTSSIYYGQYEDSPYQVGQLEGALPVVFMRRGLAERTRFAQSLLPGNEKVIVYDAWRPLKVQQALFDHYYEMLQSLNKGDPHWDREALMAETQKYVSLPSRDPERPSPHNTGGAVDYAIVRLDNEAAANYAAIAKAMSKERPVLDYSDPRVLGLLGELPNPFIQTDQPRSSERRWLNYQQTLAGIITQHGRLLNFGAPFDHGSIESSLNYYEVEQTRRVLTPSEIEARDNRRKLYNISRIAGLEPLDSEYWHHNAPESQMGAMTSGRPSATYGGVLLSEENIVFINFARMIDKIMPYRETRLAKAAVISPSR